jgi:hypothetical protein
MLTEDEGTTFLNDVLTQARESADEWPVSPDVVRTIVSAVAEKFDLTPRRLLKAAGLVFELAAMDLEDGLISDLTSGYVTALVDRGDFSGIDEQEGKD